MYRPLEEWGVILPILRTVFLHKLSEVLLSIVFHKQPYLPFWLHPATPCLSHSRLILQTVTYRSQIVVFFLSSLGSCQCHSLFLDIPFLPPLFSCPLNLHIQDCSSSLHSRKSFQNQVYIRRLSYKSQNALCMSPSWYSFLSNTPACQAENLRAGAIFLFAFLSPVPTQCTHQTLSQRFFE